MDPKERLATVVKAYDVRGVVPDELDTSVVAALGAAYVDVLAPGRVVVGRDMRTSSPALAAAFIDAVTARGVPVVDIGLAATDQLYYASGSLNLPGAMFTASHNPARYGGIKFCRAGAAPIGADTGLDAMRERAVELLLEGAELAAGPAAEPAAGGHAEVERRDVLADYTAYLRTLVDLRDVRPLRIVVDAGNGMAGLTVPAALDGLPVRLERLYFELDGTFPNHEANPIDPENLRDVRAAVVEHSADLGLAFDGDADRCFVVDERGTPVSPSAITALIASRELSREPGATILHNLITSRAVPEIVRERGGTPVRTRVGHSIIKAEMAASGAVFGGEHSAHYYFRDFWRADSGLLASLHLVAALAEHGSRLSELMADYDRYAASGEVNSTVADQEAALAEVAYRYAERPGVRLDRLDGLTVEHDDWWFNLRPSNTEPLLRLNVEAGDRAAMERVRDEVLALIRAQGRPQPRTSGQR